MATYASQPPSTLVDALAAFGMVAPALYGPALRFDDDFRRDRPEFAYALRTGLMVNDAHAVRSGRLSGVSVAPVRALQLGLVDLFGYSLVKA